MELLTPRFTSGSALAISMVLLIGISGLGQAAGIHAFLLAFLLGLAFRDVTRLANRSFEGAYDTLRGIVTNILAPLYFVSIGLQANFIAGFDPALVLLVLVVACAGKLLGAGLGAWLGRLALQKALYVGVSLNARGAIEIVLASVALQHNLIDERIFVALVLMALLTSLASGLVIPRLARSPATALLDPGPEHPTLSS
jgi:Kef-type K+ transport system membrane component KefB